MTGFHLVYLILSADFPLICQFLFQALLIIVALVLWFTTLGLRLTAFFDHFPDQQWVSKWRVALVVRFYTSLLTPVFLFGIENYGALTCSEALDSIGCPSATTSSQSISNLPCWQTLCLLPNKFRRFTACLHRLA